MARLAWLLVLSLCAACGGATARPDLPVQVDQVVLVQIDGLGAEVLTGYLQRPAAQADDRLLARLDFRQSVALADIGIDGATAAAALITATDPAKLTDASPPLFDLVPGVGLAAGFPAGKQIRIEGDDPDRIKAIEAAPPANLVALRLELLAQAQADFGLAPGTILAAHDRLLARLHAKYPNALLIIVGGGGAAPRQAPSAGPDWFQAYNKDQPTTGLAKFLKVDPKQLRAMGGALWIDGLDAAGVAKLATLEFNQAIFQRDPKAGVQIFDRDLKAFRAIHQAEFPDWPNLQARIERVLKSGQILTLAHRGGGFDYQAGPEAAKVARGGAAQRESAVAVLFAGPMIRGAAPAQVELADLPGLIRAARTGGKHPLWQQLTARPTPAPDSDWARCRKSGDCAALVDTARDPAPAADALIAAKAYAAARLVDPAAPLPEGISVGAPPPIAGKRIAFGDEPKGFAPTAIELPSAAHAALVVRTLGLEAAAWQDSVVVAVPHIHALGGPAHFAGPLMEADGYVAFAKGVAALRRGDSAGAHAALGAATGLTPEAELWRQILFALAARGVSEITEKPDFPTATGWPNVAAQALRIFVGDEEAALPLLPNEATARQKALYGAFARRVATSLPCAQIDSQVRVKELADVQARFEASGLPAFAAFAALDRAGLIADPAAARAAMREAMVLARDPASAGSRTGIYVRILLTQILRPRFAQAADAELNAAAEALLLQIQADIAADRARGQDGVERLLALVDGVAMQRQPELVVETIEFAIDKQSKTAAAVVQALLASGGIASLLKPNAFQHLLTTLRLMETALKNVPEGDGPDERVARAMPRIVKALLMALQGGMEPARAELKAASAMLPLKDVFAAREAALRAAGEKGDASIAAWGPLTKGLIVAGQGVAALMSADRAAAMDHGREFVELARLYARAELTRAKIKGFEAPVDALAHVLTELVRFAGVADDPKQAKAATQRMLTAARAFPLDAPAADPEVRPWLRLAGVLVHDLAWLLAKEGDAKALVAPTAALDALVADWAVTSTLARGGLYLLLAGQHALPDLGALLESESKAASLNSLPRVREALKTMVAAIRARYPADQVGEALKADQVERIFIEHVLHIADHPELVSGDGLPAALTGVNARLRAAAAGAKGDVRDVLLLIESALAAVQDDYEAAIRWAREGAQGPAGPAFAQLPAIWPAVIAGWQARAGDRKGALATLDLASAACPTLEHRFALARAVHAAAGGEKFRARDAFKAARVAARAAGNGGVDAFFQLNVQDEAFVLQTKIQIATFGLLLGRASGSFQLGAGGTSTARNVRSIGWLLTPQASPVDAALEALSLEAWTALARGDQGTAGGALSRMVALFFGVDPRHLDGLAAEGLPPLPEGAINPRSARLILWTAVLAEQHGFEALGGWLVRMISQRAEADWPDPPGGTETVCKRELPDGAPPLANKLTCNAPAVLHHLIGADGAEAFEKLVRARMLSPETVPAARQALADAVPTLLPRPSPGRTALEAIRGGASDAKQVREAVEAGFTCELGALAVNRKPLQSRLLGEMAACGPVPLRLALVSAAVDEGNATTILETVEAALTIDAWAAADLGFAKSGWLLARKTMLDDQRARLAERAAHWRQVAERLEAPAEVAWFEALRIAASGDAKAAEPALVAAWNAGLTGGEPLRFFKQVMAGQFDAARKELLP